MRVELHYDRMGSRLVGIGGTEIRYDLMGIRPSWLGHLELHYDRMGSRLVGIGGTEIRYDLMGARLRWVGDIGIKYGRLGNRPKDLTRESDAILTSEELMIMFFVLFFVLFLQNREPT
jgi:hypothetical protein